MFPTEVAQAKAETEASSVPPAPRHSEETPSPAPSETGEAVPELTREMALAQIDVLVDGFAACVRDWLRGKCASRDAWQEGDLSRRLYIVDVLAGLLDALPPATEPGRDLVRRVMECLSVLGREDLSRAEKDLAVSHLELALHVAVGAARREVETQIDRDVRTPSGSAVGDQESELAGSHGRSDRGMHVAAPTASSTPEKRMNLLELIQKRRDAYVSDGAFEDYLATQTSSEEARRQARILHYGCDPHPETAPATPSSPDDVRGLARQIAPDAVIEEGLALIERWRGRPRASG